MPVLVAPLVGLTLGVVFARAGAEEIARAGGAATSRTLAITALFSALVFAPIVGYFVASFPDWSYAYLVPPERRPAALDMAVLLVAAASPSLGLVVLAPSAAAQHGAVLGRAATATALSTLLVVLASAGRLRVYATYAEFHGDFGTEPLSGSPAGFALVWMTVVMAGGVAWTLRALARVAEAPRSH